MYLKYIHGKVLGGLANGWQGTPSRPLSRVEVLTHLRARISKGDFPPGHVLQEKIIAEELGVSKTPVREALQYLTAMGMVKPYSRIGYVVAPIGLKDMIEVFQFRALMEDELVRMVASAAPEPVVGIPQSEDLLAREMAFHQSLYQRHAPSRMTDALVALLEQTSRAIVYADMDNRVIASVAEEHGAINAAVIDRDVRLARALMTVHLRHLRESLFSKLRQQLRETKNFL